MKMQKKRIVGLAIVLSLFLSFGSAFAANSSRMNPRWSGGAHVGISPYVGLIGLELQQDNFGLTLGWPASIGVRYYFDPSGTQWFLGTHILHYDIERDRTKDGVRYTEQKGTLVGMGVGYKLRVKTHWDFTLSFSLAYQNETLRNPTQSRTEEKVLSLPGLTVGYAF